MCVVYFEHPHMHAHSGMTAFCYSFTHDFCRLCLHYFLSRFWPAPKRAVRSICLSQKVSELLILQRKLTLSVKIISSFSILSLISFSILFHNLCKSRDQARCSTSTTLACLLGCLALLSDEAVVASAGSYKLLRSHYKT